MVEPMSYGGGLHPQKNWDIGQIVRPLKQNVNPPSLQIKYKYKLFQNIRLNKISQPEDLQTLTPSEKLYKFRLKVQG